MTDELPQTSHTLPSRKRRAPSPVYLEVRRLVDPETGEELGAFVPKFSKDRELFRRRRYTVGKIVRAELHAPRNLQHHRLFMAMLQFVVENTERFPSVDVLLFWLKIEMGRCEPYVDIRGRVFYVPESIAFDAMGQDEFDLFFNDACGVIAAEFFPGWDAARVSHVAKMIMGDSK